MKQEQAPKNAAVPAETFSAGGYIPGVEHRRGNERIMEAPNPGNGPVTSEDISRIDQQIKGAFEAADNPERLGSFEPERSTLRQATHVAKNIPFGLLAKLGFSQARKFLSLKNKPEDKKSGTHG